MPSLARAVFHQLDPVRVVRLVLSRSVRPLRSLGAGELDDRTRFDFRHRSTR
jgi:hypothetical protein